jgi:hypothetical protein
MFQQYLSYIGFLKTMCLRDGTLDFIDIHKEFSKQDSVIKPLFDTNDVSGVHISSSETNM